MGAPLTLNNAVATLTTTLLSTGANSITAAYSGDSNFNSSTSTAATVFVGNPDFQIAVNPGNVTVSSSTPGTAKILVSPGPGIGLAGAVSFACSGQPSGTSCSFQPSTLNLDGFTPQTTSLTISMTSGASASTGRSLFAGSAGGIGLACVFILGWTGRRRSRFGNMLILVILLGVAAGCGGGGSSSPSSNGTTTTSSSYVLVVTATSGSGTSAVSHSVSLSVTGH
jgi:Bacterial Ig-like domain (group 3)